MVPEYFMWVWMRVVHTKMEKVPLLEGPQEAGVVVGPPGVWSLQRVCLPSSACVIPGADSPGEISWLWLCYWDTDAQVLHSKLMVRIFEMML